MLRKEFTNPMNNSGMLKEAVNIARVELIDPSQPTTLSMSMSRMPVRHKYSASLLPMLTIITV